MQHTAIIILAAGASTRMGKPKQQLPLENDNLLQHITHTALATGCSPVIVVLGAYAATISRDIAHLPVHTVINKQWETGMAGSIRTGIQTLLQLPGDHTAAFLLVCDQPYITTALLQQMMNMQVSSGKNMIACSYNDTTGTPVLFHHTCFPALCALTGLEGAKKLLTANSADIATVSFPQGAIDIDTPEDYRSFTSSGL